MSRRAQVPPWLLWPQVDEGYLHISFVAQSLSSLHPVSSSAVPTLDDELALGPASPEQPATRSKRERTGIARSVLFISFVIATVVPRDRSDGAAIFSVRQAIEPRSGMERLDLRSD